jgi:hypothetical protein
LSISQACSGEIGPKQLSQKHQEKPYFTLNLNHLRSKSGIKIDPNNKNVSALPREYVQSAFWAGATAPLGLQLWWEDASEQNTATVMITSK